MSAVVQEAVPTYSNDDSCGSCRGTWRTGCAGRWGSAALISRAL